MQKAFNEFGEESFTFEIIEECRSSEQHNREVFWIETFGIENLFNTTTGQKRKMILLQQIMSENEEKKSLGAAKIAAAINSTPSRVQRFITGAQNPPLELAMGITKFVNENYGKNFTVQELFSEIS